MKRVLTGLVVMFVIIVGALFVLPPMVGNSLVKPKIVEAVKEATGRDVRISDVSVALLPSIKISLTDLRLANVKDTARPDMLSLGRMDLDLQLFPLISKAIMVERLVVSDLTAFLEVNEAGEPNWIFEGGGKQEAAKSGEGGGVSLGDLRLGDVRLENARLSYADRTSGQTIAVSDANLKATLPNIAAKLMVRGSLALNEKPADIVLDVESPQALMTGERAKLTAAMTSELITLHSNLTLAQNPQPALDGSATIDIESVAALLTWLGRPLAQDQPDPGPVKLAATFKTEDAKVILQEALIEGDALDVMATGSYESANGVNKVVLALQSDVLDIDRYLRRPAGDTAVRDATDKQHGEAGARGGNPLEIISDEPIDVTLLTQTEASITIALAGIKAAGYEIGKLALAAQLVGGKLETDLSELALYGGGVTGTLSMDGSGEALDLDVDFKLDNVDLGALAAVASEGEAPVAGVASGSLTASASGASARALVQDLKGALIVKLGKVDVKDAVTGAISGVDLAVDLPGLSRSPSVKGEVVYNKRTVALDVGLDPLEEVLAGETFALKATLDSELLKLSYDGAVQQQPLAGLDGHFNVASPSVGKLAAWLGHPLDPEQPDPGPVKVEAVLKAEGEKVVLEQAVIEGTALKAKATGSVDISGGVRKVVLDVEAGMLNIDRYLPPAEPAQKAEAPAVEEGQRPVPTNPLVAIPDDPIELTALRGTEADVSIAFDGLRAGGFEVGQAQIGLKLADGKLALDIGQLALYGGGAKGRVDLDGSGDVLAFVSEVSITNLAVGELTRAVAIEPAPLEGAVTASLKAKSQGKSPRALVAALSGDLGMQMSSASLSAVPDLTIGTLDASLVVSALDQATEGKIALTLNGKPLEAILAVDSPQKAMHGEAFALDVAVTSELLEASVSGSVQQRPLPGLNGSIGLDMPSIGELAAWLGQPLPEDQPDPGPLKVKATIAADGGKVAIKSATITGKAALASASGSVDGTGEITRFDGKLDVANLDLNAYLPPPTEAGAAEAAPVAEDEGAKGWSEEPIDVSLFRNADGQVQVDLAKVLYREVQVQNAVAVISLSGGVLKADVTKVQLTPGIVMASAVVDGSGDDAAIRYEVALQGVESNPFLRSFANVDWLSGKLNFQSKGTAHGTSEKQIVSTLNGDGAFTFLDGAIEGIDLAETLRSIGELGISSDGAKPKTDFTELSGTYTVTNGVLQNNDLKMLAPLVRVGGAGEVNMPPQTLDYNVEAKLVASLEGQGGSDALAGLPIPVHAYGSWDNLSYDVDYGSMFNAAAADPSRLANLPADISGKASEFGVNLPLPGLGDTEGGALQEVLGGASDDSESGGVGGALGGAVKGLLGGGEQAQPKTEEASVPSDQGSTPSQQQEQPSVPDAGKLLKGLFQ